MAAFEKNIVGDDIILKNIYGLFSKNELETQLREGHLTIGELGSIYSLKEYQIIHVLKSLDITYRNNLNDTRIIESTIDGSLHQVLIGTLLGDAYMTNNSYSLGHGISQYDYCYHVAERLNKFIASFGDFNTKAKTKKSLNFWTFRHDVFKSYLSRFYSHGMDKKYFTEKTAYDLEPEGLAYWYMDDGKYGKYGVNLCVGDISEEEGEILTKLLKSKFSLHSNLQCYDSKNENYTIYIQAKSRSHFYDLISPYIIPSMRYKITGSKFQRIPFKKDLIVNRHLQLCEKAGRYVRYFGDKDIQKEILKKNKFEDFKSKYIKKVKVSIEKDSIVSKRIKRDVSKEDLIKLFDEGCSDQQIADKYGFGRKRIASLRRSLGIVRKNSRVTQDKLEQLKELFSEPDMTIQKAMKRLHLSFYKVKEWIKENKI